MLRRKFSTTTLSMTKPSRLISLPFSLGGKALSCTVPRATEFRIVPRRCKRKTGQDVGNGGSRNSSKHIIDGPWLPSACSLEAAGEVLPTISYVTDFGRRGAERSNWFGYGNGLSIAPKAEAEIGGEDIAIVVDRNMTDARGEDDRHVQGN